ncbi:glycosyltransferase family 39 protein [Nocardia arthritidis]|uniref:glycosyltransferase family 39 protein n=1 Tax=Nocardia arthritidis TaxID=228602 RepID=UPI000B043864|nr:glycosyltransferase family 39 protein [Nocardia arthritidis]
MLDVPPRPADSGEPLPPFALGGVGVVAALGALALLVSIGRYGFFGDELYFVAAGRRLAVGYADQGPLLPAIAGTMDLLAPGSLVALRLPAVLVTVAAVLVTAQIAREFGGGRAAQALTAAAYGTSPFLLVQGSLLATNTIDTALWVVVSWLVVRWVRTRRDGLLLASGLVTALDMQVKWLIPVFWIALAVGVAVYGPRELLRRPALWCGGVVVALTCTPSLAWQAAHGWPQLRLGGVVAAEQATIGGRAVWLPLALASAGLLGGILLIYGVWTLLRAENWRPYRFLGLLPLVLVVVFIATNGRPYYAAGCYGVLIAAGGALDGEYAALAGARHRPGAGALRRTAGGLAAAASGDGHRTGRRPSRGRPGNRGVRAIRVVGARGGRGIRVPGAAGAGAGVGGGDRRFLLAGKRSGCRSCGLRLARRVQPEPRVRILRRPAGYGDHGAVGGRRRDRCAGTLRRGERDRARRRPARISRCHARSHPLALRAAA